MIISASRRTDIPAFYSDWFIQRIHEGFVYVRNPLNIHKISKIELNPDIVDGIVFWTKNPTPMIDKLDEFKQYNYYFQFTLNSYGSDIEIHVPKKKDVIIPAFKKLSSVIGAHRVIWRYDPIFFTDVYNADYHIKYFELLAKQLCGYTDKCIISFIDDYRCTLHRMECLKWRHLSNEEIIYISQRFLEIAQKYNIRVESCSEKINLDEIGIPHGHCIDQALLESIGNFKLKIGKDKTQREECGCVTSVDIGMYDTCPNKCLYCYATRKPNMVAKNYSLNKLNSPLIVGDVMSDDVVISKERKSNRTFQEYTMNDLLIDVEVKK